MKKTLIIHPKDKSTNFLRSIYKDIPYKTIITGGCSKQDIISEIMTHDRVIMLGHGHPLGLFSVGQFGKTFYIVDSTMVDYLKVKECVYIWCNADKFVEANHLSGFYSGMFISEVGESEHCGFKGITQTQVSNSNYTFSEIVGRHIHKPLSEVYENVKNEYGVLCDTNPIAKYNHERLYYKTNLVFNPDGTLRKIIKGEEEEIITETEKEQREKYINEHVIPTLNNPRFKDKDPDSVLGYHRLYCLERYEKHFGHPFAEN